MLKFARRIVFGTVALVLISASAFAQGKQPVKSVLDGYTAGVKAVQAGKFAEAITALNAAVAADPLARSYKEGVFSGDYYPQFYLFVAYAGQKDMVNASRFYSQRGNVPPAVAKDGATAVAAFTQWQNDNRAAQQNAAQFDKLLGDGNTALNAKNYDGAITAFDSASKLAGIDDAKKKQATDKLTQARNEAKALADANAANQQKLATFNTARDRGNTALGNRQWADALTAFNNAKTTFPEEFQRQNLQGKIDEATNGQRTEAQARTDFNGMVQRGNTAYNAKNWAGAIKEFGDAKAKLPSDFNSQGLQAKLDDANKQKSNVDSFETAVKNADAAFASKNYADAKTNYQLAKDKIPAEFNNRKLQAKLDTATTEFNKLGAEQAKKAEVDSMIKNADNALGARRFDDAITGYNAVKAKYAPEFAQRNLQAKIDEATRGKTQAANDKIAADRAAADKLAAAEKEKADKLAAAEKAAQDKLAEQAKAANAAQLAEKNAHDGLLALLT